MGSDPDELGKLMAGYGYSCFILGKIVPGKVFNVLFSNSFKVDGDAQALICAEEVRADKKRLVLAMKAAKTMKAELEQEMKAVSKISRKGK
jgi:hypothetical protein